MTLFLYGAIIKGEIKVLVNYQTSIMQPLKVGNDISNFIAHFALYLIKIPC